MIPYSIYIVDDEPTIREGISISLKADYKVQAFPSAEAALKALKAHIPDLILLDIGLPGMSGIDALSEIKKDVPDILVIMITAYEDIKTVISAMKLGAYDYVVKPIHMDSLEITIKNALETIKLRKEVRLLQERYLQENLPCYVAESNAIKNIMDFIELVAKSPDTPILILGETGTGKEFLASTIHYRSPNYKGPLVTVNCAAIPQNLIESELFGYEKGAFSGANPLGKRGLIEEAAQGTLFLDEVGDLSLEAQAKLLRFLEEGEFYRVGGTKKMQVSTRIVSATNKDLEAMMDQDRFRKDLYFRLGVIKIQVPSLNERPDDIIPLARHFLFEFSRKFKKNFTDMTAEVQSTLLGYAWEGNVRELRNLIERGVLVGKGPELALEDLGIEPSKTRLPSSRREGGFSPIPPEGIDLTTVEEAFQRHYIEEALRMAGGNESQAAKLLGINHHTFRYRRKNLQIQPKQGG